MAVVKAISKKGAYYVPERKWEGYLDLSHNIDAFRGRYEDAVESEFHRQVGEPVIVRLVDVVPFVEKYSVEVGENEYIDVLVSIPVDEVHDFNVLPIGRGKIDQARAEAGEMVYTEDLRGKSPSEIFLSEEGVSDEEILKFVEHIRENTDDVREVHPFLVTMLQESGQLSNPNPDRIRELMSLYLSQLAKHAEDDPVLGRLLYNELKIYGLSGLKLGDKELKKKVSLAELIRGVVEGEDPPEVKVKRVPLNAVCVGVAVSDKEESIVLGFFPERVSLRSPRSIAKDLSASYDYRLLNYFLSMMKNPEAVAKYDNVRAIVESKLEKKLNEMKAREEADVYVSAEVMSLFENVLEAVRKADAEGIKSGVALARKMLISHLRENISKNGLFKPGDVLVRKKSGDGYFLRDQLANIGNTLTFWEKVQEAVRNTKTSGESKRDYAFLIMCPMPRIINDDGQLIAKSVYKPYGLAVGKPGEVVEAVFNKADAYHMAFDYALYKILRGIEKADSWETVRRLFSEGTEKVEGLELFERKVAQHKNVAPIYQDVISHIRAVFKSLIYTPDDDPEMKLEEAKTALHNDPFLSDYMRAVEDFLLTRYQLRQDPKIALPLLENEQLPLLSDARDIASRIRASVEWSAGVARRGRLRTITAEQVAAPPPVEAPEGKAQEEQRADAAQERDVHETAMQVVDALVESGEMDREAKEAEELVLGVEGFEMDWDEVAHDFDRAMLRNKQGGGNAPKVAM